MTTDSTYSGQSLASAPFNVNVCVTNSGRSTGEILLPFGMGSGGRKFFTSILTTSYGQPLTCGSCLVCQHLKYLGGCQQYYHIGTSHSLYQHFHLWRCDLLFFLEECLNGDLGGSPTAMTRFALLLRTCLLNKSGLTLAGVTESVGGIIGEVCGNHFALLRAQPLSFISQPLFVYQTSLSPLPHSSQ